VRAVAWLRRRAEDFIALLLGVMFLAFIVQIVFRYFMNLPTGWTSELTVVAWLWMVLFGTAFVLRDDEEIRFDLLQASASRRTRRVMGALAAVAIVVLYGVSLPASFDYVAFMKVERASYLKIRLDHLYSIYVIFIVAVIARYLWALWRLLKDPADAAAAE
jgi:TRAP-type C4-dicarboxylate transport system permease small subunit